MKNLWIAAALACGLVFGPLAAAKLPATPPMSDADKAAKAEKEAAAKAKEAEELGRAQDKAAANYKKHHGGEGKAAAASVSGKASVKK
jgi:hypothetical protein